jgi:hypothetical protein
MIAYTGHPEYDFVYECRIRGPNLGCFVGISRHAYGEFVLPENHTPRIKPLLDSLHPIDSDGIGVDGDGAFHGTPKGRVFVEATKGCEDVFGKYPENLKKHESIKLIEKDSSRLRKQFETDVSELIRKWSSERTRMYYRDRYAFAEAACEDISALADRYFK